MPPKRLSGLQKNVLALYRSILREATKKDRLALKADPTSMPSFASLLHSSSQQGKSTLCYARSEFRNQAMKVKRSDFKKIEYMIRKGEKQVKLLKMLELELDACSRRTDSGTCSLELGDEKK